MPSTISPSESFSLSNRAFEQINHDQTLSARSTDYFDTSTTGYRTVEKAPATSFQRGAVVVAEDRGVSHESDHRQRVEGFPLSKRSAQILPPIFYSVVPAPPSAQSSPLSTPSSTPSLSSTKSDDSVPSLESLASSPPPTPPTSSQPGPPDEYLDELLHLRYEASRRAIETVQADFLASLLKRTITYPLSTSLPNPSRPSSPTSIAKQPTSVILLQEIADRLRELTLCSSAAILDTRAFHCPPMGGTARPSLHRRDSEEEREDSDPDELSSKTRTGTGKIALMGVSGDVDWRQALSQGKVGKEVCEALRRFSADEDILFNHCSSESPFMTILGAATTATLIVPLVEADHTPAMLFILSSSEPGFTFELADARFAESVGAAAIGALVRQRALEAERSSSTFLSQVSHELRTPLHGITSQVELIREFSSPSQLLKLSPVLDVIECCIDSLRDCLNDTLDYGKLSNSKGSHADIAAAHARAVVPATLSTLCEDVARASWVRKKRVDLVSSDVGAMPSPEVMVDVAMAVEDRMEGWNALIDVGGLKRVLFNILGNALKFTKSGSVTMTLRQGKRLLNGMQMVHIDIQDTGIGMTDDFIRTKLFVAFCQADGFSSGAGLGMALSADLLRRMGGELDVVSTLGQGTRTSITLPVSFTSPSSPGPLPASFLRTRCISDELAHLLGDGGPLSSPALEHAGFDFSQAVNAAQSTLAGTGGGGIALKPSLRRKRSAFATSPHRTATMEVADDLIKLSLTTGSPTAPAFNRAAPPRLPAGACRLASLLPPSRFPTPLVTPSRTTTANLVHVLVADDNPIARNILTKLFSGKGIAFQQASDGQKLVEAFTASKGEINLVLADVQMPHKSGPEAATEIRALEKERGWAPCRIVALTGCNSDTTLQNGPFDSWIVKGGRTLRLVLDEVKALQSELEEHERGRRD